MIEITKNEKLKQELTKAKDKLESDIGNGVIDMAAYGEMIKKNKEEDKARMEVYRKLDLASFYHFAKARIKIIDEELANFW